MNGLDDLDLRLIGLLRDDGRLPTATLARRLGVSRGTVQNRMDRLMRDGVILGFALFGQQLLGYMHISLPALQASGGLLLLLVAMELLTGKLEDPEAPKGNVNVAMVPLGTPLLAGPGAIVAAMLFVQRVDGSVTDWVSVAVGFALVLVSLWVAMRFAGVVMKVLGESGTILVTRIAGLLLAAIAVQLVADAVIAFVQTA